MSDPSNPCLLYGVCPRCQQRLLPGDECLPLVMSIQIDPPSPAYPGGYEAPRLEYIHVRCSRLLVKGVELAGLLEAEMSLPPLPQGSPRHWLTTAIRWLQTDPPEVATAIQAIAAALEQLPTLPPPSPGGDSLPDQLERLIAILGNIAENTEGLWTEFNRWNNAKLSPLD